MKHAGLEGRHVLLGDDVVFPEEGKLGPVPLRFHRLLAELGCHPGRIVALAYLAQNIQIVDILTYRC